MHPSGSLTSIPAFAGLPAELTATPARTTEPARCARAEAREVRRRSTRSRLRRVDQRIGAASLASAALAMPLVASPEGASVLAVAAIALLAGQRWAIGLVIVAELVLLSALLPFAMTKPSALATAAAVLSIAAALPCLAATRRGAAALVLLCGLRRTPATCRAIHFALLALAVFAGCSPLL